jgi:dihydropteroate synthase
MKLKFRGKELDLAGRTAVCGILNITPDSFSDGGRYAAADKAVDRALSMEDEGADLIDVGAESTRPGANPVSPEEEIKRLIPVVKELKSKLRIPLSIDTFKPETAREALLEGADIINDITGLREDNAMAELVARAGAGIVIMHMQGVPADMQNSPRYENAPLEVKSFLEKQAGKAVSAGIPAENIAVDPGIGFGKTTVHNLQLINSLDSLSLLGYPVFIGISRKSVIGDVLKLPVGERTEGTAALAACSILRGAGIIRVHEVACMKKIALMTDAVKFRGKSD